MDKPASVQIRARDVRPYHYALWCSVGGGEPFANDIVLAKWAEDSKQIVFMLDSHNFYFADADVIIELIPLEAHAVYAEKYGAASGWSLGDPPAPNPTICAACGKPA